ncbi:hypothetical protein [Bacillus fonticola]|uniref:hypothetical protein n=1 Tax=Bacillus fonticola TaxID=2728853 RepID=UPI0014756B02|nr:hypothetical protein [Bacillus fonticola]
MSRGQAFNSKTKGHPGNLPKQAFQQKQATTEAQEDEEFLVVQEAFKNRIEPEEK